MKKNKPSEKQKPENNLTARQGRAAASQRTETPPNRHTHTHAHQFKWGH